MNFGTEGIGERKREKQKKQEAGHPWRAGLRRVSLLVSGNKPKHRVLPGYPSSLLSVLSPRPDWP